MRYSTHTLTLLVLFVFVRRGPQMHNVYAVYNNQHIVTDITGDTPDNLLP